MAMATATATAIFDVCSIPLRALIAPSTFVLFVEPMTMTSACACVSVGASYPSYFIIFHFPSRSAFTNQTDSSYSQPRRLPKNVRLLKGRVGARARVGVGMVRGGQAGVSGLCFFVLLSGLSSLSMMFFPGAMRM
ncbi:hypothetical protein C8F04DRAFT_1114146 [Mycena alexandri]|uniref:Uncharacterized protein n=1 Tax=Mycena alexandri TaxID=1745969 RepID=A0AAD6X2W2_9AGAR|nr:hypothetical protein C8F04DRAFT_1114146 [Mycena alexandri]